MNSAAGVGRRGKGQPMWWPRETLGKVNAKQPQQLGQRGWGVRQREKDSSKSAPCLPRPTTWGTGRDQEAAITWSPGLR